MSPILPQLDPVLQSCARTDDCIEVKGEHSLSNAFQDRLFGELWRWTQIHPQSLIRNPCSVCPQTPSSQRSLLVCLASAILKSKLNCCHEASLLRSSRGHCRMRSVRRSGTSVLSLAGVAMRGLFFFHLKQATRLAIV